MTGSSSASEVGYPEPDEEWQILDRRQQREEDEVDLDPVMDRDAVLDAQRALEKVHVADEVSRYMVALVNETRNRSRARIGASPRGRWRCLLSRGLALLAPPRLRNPDDVKEGWQCRLWVTASCFAPSSGSRIRQVTTW